MVINWLSTGYQHTQYSLTASIPIVHDRYHQWMQCNAISFGDALKGRRTEPRERAHRSAVSVHCSPTRCLLSILSHRQGSVSFHSVLTPATRSLVARILPSRGGFRNTIRATHRHTAMQPATQHDPHSKDNPCQMNPKNSSCPQTVPASTCLVH